MAWIVFTAYNDPDSGWDTETNAYDGNTGTYAKADKQDVLRFLELTIASTTVSKLRIAASAYKVGAHVLECDIDIYYGGAWHDLFDDFLTYYGSTWNEIDIGAIYAITAARLRSRDTAEEARLYEMELWEDPPTILEPSGIASLEAFGTPAVTLAKIDIGMPATDRAGVIDGTYTCISFGNPANSTGKLDTIQVQSANTMADVKVGTFFGTPPNLACRDWTSIGSVVEGAMREFTSLDILCKQGDYLGVRGTGGNLERSTSGGVGIYYLPGDRFDGLQETFTFIANNEISVYGTGISGPYTLKPPGIASEEAFDTPTVDQGQLILSPGGIASLEAFGTPKVFNSLQILTPGGIASGEAFGTPTVVPGSVILLPGGIASEEAFGIPAVIPGTWILSPAGVSSLEAFGVPTVTPGSVTLLPGGIASLEAFGVPTIAPHNVLSAFSIASGEAFGSHTVIGPQQTLTPGGIASGEAFGVPVVFMWVSPTGFVDPDTAWVDEPYAYDDDDQTESVNAAVPSYSWCEFLELSHSEILCPSIKIYAFAGGWGNIFSACDIDVYYGSAWHHVYEGPFDNNTGNTYHWFTTKFSEEPITAARIRFYSDYFMALDAALCELYLGSIASGVTTQTLYPGGISTAEAFGIPAVIRMLQILTGAGAIASLEAFGSHQVNRNLQPAGVASLEAFGVPTVTPGSVTLLPGGIASLEAFGVPTIAPYNVLSAFSIASAEAFGTPAVVPGSVILLPGGIASEEAFGITVVGQGYLAPPGIPSAEAFGIPAVIRMLQILTGAGGIATAEAFDTTIVTLGLQTLQAVAIASAEAFGAPQVNLTLKPQGIASLEAFGIPTLLQQQFLSPGGIASEEAFGTAQVNLTLKPQGIASLEAFGIPTVIGVQSLFPGGISSLEAFGITTVIPGAATLTPAGISSLEAFGIPYVLPGAVVLLSPGISSLEAFGVPVAVNPFSQWTDTGVTSYSIALAAYGAAVFAFRAALDGILYRCESADNGGSWGSWISMGSISAGTSTRLAACFKDSNEALILYSIGGTLYRRRWNGATWETAASWSNSLASISGVSCCFMGDWNVVITGVDSAGKAGVWTCVLGNGYSAAVDSWSTLKEVMIAESGTNITYKYPSLCMPDVFRMFFVEAYTGSEAYSRPYWSHSYSTADFISNLWREPIPFNLDSAYGLAIAHKSPNVFLSRPDAVFRSPISPPFVELTEDLLSISSHISPFKGGVDVTLRNFDGRFNSLGQGDYAPIKKGSEVLLSWGYRTSSGAETGGFDPTTWIDSWEYITRGAVSDLVLHCVDGWVLLSRWKARRQFTWAGTKNIYQLLALIFGRAGLELSAYSTSAALVGLYPVFTINPGESGLTAVKRLLSMVPDVLFFVNDTAYLKNPLAADASSYSYGTDHTIMEGKYITPTQDINRVQVFGDGVFTEDWDWDEISQVYDLLSQVNDINLDTATKAHYRGTASMREADIEGLDGQILVPMNCGQDLFDVVAITSPQAGLSASKRRVLSLDRTWTPTKKESRYTLSVGLGAP